MRPRHPDLPLIWLITDERLGPAILSRIRQLPIGTGVLVRHHGLPAAERRKLLRHIRMIAQRRRLVVIDDAAGKVARVHSARELRRALAAKPDLNFLSPLFATRTHPDWRPLGRMRAAALARLASRPVLALGGMDQRRYAVVKPLGFSGWGGIDAYS